MLDPSNPMDLQIARELFSHSRIIDSTTNKRRQASSDCYRQHDPVCVNGTPEACAVNATPRVRLLAGQFAFD
ncbi:MAG: hypothetical protein ABI268_05490 [Rhodanobacter sp.]